MEPIAEDDLRSLEAEVRAALDSASIADLDVIGFGDSSVVLRTRSGGRQLVCKRLPPFPSQSALQAYGATLERHARKLGSFGIRCADTLVQEVEPVEGARIAYCIQQLVAPSSLLPAHLGNGERAAACRLLERLVEAIVSSVSPRLGLDGDITNWAVDDRDLVLVDTSTPLLRDAEGHEELDVAVFVASLPWILRQLIQRFFASSIIDKFFDRRGVLLDVLAGLHREELQEFLPFLLERINANVDRAIRAKEVLRYQRTNEILFGALRRAQRFERFWCRRVRRRVYPFLLPTH